MTGGTERVRVDASGNVGIGTTPAAQLDISGNVSIGSGNNALTIKPGYIYSNGVIPQDRAVWFDLSSTGTISFSDNVIFNNGNVGIGTTIPTAALDVNGIIKNLNPSWCMTKANDVANAAGNVVTYNTNKVTAQNCTANTSTGRVTATIAGRYFVSFCAFTENSVTAGSSVQVFVRKNGLNYIRNFHTQPYSNYSAFGGLTCIVDLAVGDYVDIYNSLGVLHYNDNCHFSGFMLG